MYLLVSELYYSLQFVSWLPVIAIIHLTCFGDLEYKVLGPKLFLGSLIQPCLNTEHLISCIIKSYTFMGKDFWVFLLSYSPGYRLSLSDILRVIFSIVPSI